jgi:hypothetical protein
MKHSKILPSLGAMLALSLPIGANAEPSNGWSDELLDHMIGKSTLEGRINGRTAHHVVQAEWVLNHQFVQIHEETSASAPASERRYEAIWLLGYDAISERYVLHLVNIFGGRFSETIGYGTRDGDEIQFLFEYSDGPFRTTMKWSAAPGSWQWLMKQKGADGKWAEFANLTLKHISQ